MGNVCGCINYLHQTKSNAENEFINGVAPPYDTSYNPISIKKKPS